MTPEERDEVRRLLLAAGRRVADADRLVEVESPGRRRRWRSRLCTDSHRDLERAVVEALRGDDAAAAREAIERWERGARRILAGALPQPVGKRLAHVGVERAPRREAS